MVEHLERASSEAVRFLLKLYSKYPNLFIIFLYPEVLLNITCVMLRYILAEL